MAQTVFANLRCITHKGTTGVNPTFPDVCKTPTPGGPVPIPYPNIGRASDTADGPKTITVDGEMPMVKGSNYSTTTGDEAGTAGGGVVSNTTKGIAEYMLYSFDVLFEGKNVGRLGDPMFQNKKNIMG